MRAPRGLLLAGGLAAAGLAAGGCSSGYGLAHAGPSDRPTSTAAMQNLAGRVHFIMNESGLPIQNGHIGCSPNAGGRSVTCYGETADEPVDKVEGDFVAPAPTAGPGGCPGTLTVKDGSTVVTAVPENPCR